MVTSMWEVDVVRAGSRHGDTLRVKASTAESACTAAIAAAVKDSGIVGDDPGYFEATNPRLV